MVKRFMLGSSHHQSTSSRSNMISATLERVPDLSTIGKVVALVNESELRRCYD